MKVALLISGEPRTIVFNEQIEFFKSLVRQMEDDGHTVHVYMLFKIRNEPSFIASNEGISNFMKLLYILNPVFIQFIDEYEKEKESSGYYSQIKMIDELLEKASKIDYDFFFRVRPDAYIKTKIIFPYFSHDTVYTSNKCDSVGNDQVIMFHRSLLDSWWIPFVRPTLYEEVIINRSPEYVIFNNCKIRQVLEGGLVRDFNYIRTWHSDPKYKMVTDDYWFDFESYRRLKISISTEEFIGKLKAQLTKRIPFVPQNASVIPV